METNKTFTPFATAHPTEIIKDEIKARGMTKKEFAERMGMQQSNVSRLLKGEDITPKTAERLEQAFGISASYWLNMQTVYNQDCRNIAKRNEEEQRAIEIESAMASQYNVAYLYKYFKINAAFPVRKKLAELKKICGIDIDEAYRMLPVGNFKQNEKFNTDKKNLHTWLLLAYLVSRNASVNAEYKKGDAALAAQEIASYTHDNDITEEKIRTILANRGIAYSVVKNLTHTHIDAYSSWAGDHPAVVVTHRYDDMCRLVFDVLHELGHIDLHLSENKDQYFISSEDALLSDKVREQEANNFAAETLIKSPVWNDIMKSQTRGLRPNNILHVLKEQATHHNLNYGIIVWRYKYETKNYALAGFRPERIM